MELNYCKLSEDISNWIKKEVEVAKALGVVIGLSGGLDSSVVAALCKKAMKDKVLGLILPCESSKEDIDDALLISSLLEIETKYIDLTNIYLEFKKLLPGGTKVGYGNLKSRLRMTTLYYFANTLNYLVVGSSNKSELTVGYFTKYGDGAADILPIASLLKNQVRKLALELAIPKKIIEKVPTAGLWEGQTDESELGIKYDELDKAIMNLEKKDCIEVDKTIIEKVQNLFNASGHKRALPKIYPLTNCNNSLFF